MLIFNGENTKLYNRLGDAVGATVHSLAYAMMVCKFPDKSEWGITEDNWREVYTRVNAYELLCGAMRTAKCADGSAPVMFTASEIQDLIGFTVNVGTQTDRQFWSNMRKHHIENTNRETASDKAKAA